MCGTVPERKKSNIRIYGMFLIIGTQFLLFNYNGMNEFLK